MAGWVGGWWVSVNVCVCVCVCVCACGCGGLSFRSACCLSFPPILGLWQNGGCAHNVVVARNARTKLAEAHVAVNEGCLLILPCLAVEVKQTNYLEPTMIPEACKFGHAHGPHKSSESYLLDLESGRVVWENMPKFPGPSCSKHPKLPPTLVVSASDNFSMGDLHQPPRFPGYQGGSPDLLLISSSVWLPGCLRLQGAVAAWELSGGLG